jgi:hypothetical protein
MSTVNEPAAILAFNQSILLDNQLFWSGTELFVISPNGSDGRYNPCLDRWEIIAEPRRAISALIHVEAGVYAATYATGGIPDGLLFLDFASATWKQRSFAGFYNAAGVVTRATERYVYRFGGIAALGNPYNVLSNQGARYDQNGDAWKDLAREAAPAPRLLSGNVTTAGDELVVWGGALSGPPATTVTPGDPAVRALVETPGVVCPEPVPQNCSFGDGAIYDPVSERWRSMTRTGAPKPRRDHVLAFTGTHVLVFGGSAYEYSAADSYSKWMRYDDGGLYDLATDSWTPIVGPSELTGVSFSAEWRNQRLVVWADTGGQGFIYDLSTRTWHPVSPRPPGSGIKPLDPVSNTWNAPPDRAGAASSPAMIWTGTYWLQWGGIRYLPVTTTGCENVPPGTGCDPLGPEPYGVTEGAVLVPKP